MKKIISAIISMLMIVPCFPSSFAAEGNVTSHYIQYDQYACIKTGDEGYTGLYDKTRFDVWSSGQDSADPKNPVRAAYWKFDLDDYVSATQEIKTAVVLFCGIETSYPSSVKMYDCEKNVVNGSNYLNVPEPDTSYSIGSFTLQGVKSVADTYTGVSEAYNVSVDITNYVKGKTKAEDNDFTFMMYPEWGWSVYGFTNVPVLYVETTEVVDRSNILSPVASVYTGSQIPDNTKPLSNGGGYLYAYPNVDATQPGKALFYKFDLSKYTDSGIGIEKAEYLQLTNSPGYSRLFYIYDIPENNLENGQKYADVSKPARDANPLKQIANPGSDTVIDKQYYPGVEYDYNFTSDLTDYIREKIRKGEKSVTLMICPGYQTTAGYDLLSPPVLYITPEVYDPDKPVEEVVFSPEAWAYTCWGDDTQTSKPYKPADQYVGNYWLYGNGTGVDIYLKYSDYWQKPLRALYHKFDMSEYIGNGYSVKSAYLIQKSGNGHVMLADCPDNDLESGDVYNTVPMHEKEAAQGFSVGNGTNTYYTPAELREKFSKARSDDNMAVNITDYVNKKIAEGNTSFTFMEYSRYAGDRACFSNYAQLYLFLEREAVVQITDVTDAYQNQNFTVSAKAGYVGGIERVDFYIDKELVGTDSDAEDGIYCAEISGIDAGIYSLRAVAVSNTGGYTVAQIPDFEVKRIYDNIPASVTGENISFDISAVDLSKVEKIYITAGMNSTSASSEVVISDVGGKVLAVADSKNINSLNGYNYGVLLGNNLAIDVTDYVKSASDIVEFTVDTEAEITKEPVLYIRYRTENSAIDKAWKPMELTGGFKEFAGRNKLYLTVPDGATLSDFKTASGFNDIKARNKAGTLLTDSSVLSKGDTITTSDRTYTVAKNGDISDIQFKMAYGKSEATATVDVCGEISDANFILAGYDNHNKLVTVAMSRYEDINGGLLTVTAGDENAYYYKAMLLDNENYKPLTKVARKDRQVVVLKADDFSLDMSYSFENFREILASRGLKAGIGVIVSSLDKDNPNYNTQNNYANRLAGATEVIHRALADGFEFWHHGYEHSDREFCETWTSGGNVVGYNKEQQRESFQKGYDVLNNNFDTDELDLQVHSFGSPGNRATQLTMNMLSEYFPEIKVVMRASSSIKMPEGMINMQQSQSVAMEFQVPAAQFSVCIDYERFLADYANNSEKPLLCVQMHPGLWDRTDPGSWDEFEKCVDYLMEQGAVFMTPYEYYNYINKEN